MIHYGILHISASGLNFSLSSLFRGFPPFSVMACSHCSGVGPGQVQEMGMFLGAMGTDMLYRNVHTGPRQGKEPGSIVSYCTCQIPCTCPGSVPVQCK